MPTVLRSGPYRFFFYSADRRERPHIHVERDRSTAKFWLAPVSLESSAGFPRVELEWLRKLVESNNGSFLKAWHEFFAS